MVNQTNDRERTESGVQYRIQDDLQRAKQEGQLRAERIRDIIRTAFSQTKGEFKAGSGEIRSIVKTAIATVLENFQDKGKDVQERVEAVIEGVVDGISHTQQATITKTQSEIQRLQAEVADQETQLYTEVDQALQEIETTGQDSSSDVRSAIDAAVHRLKDSEEVQLMQKRYAQLRAQLAILDANLAARYGDRYEEVKQHLETGKAWYERARVHTEETGSGWIQHKQDEVEIKMGEAGSALARREKQVKQRLKELWRSMSSSFRDDHSSR